MHQADEGDEPSHTNPARAPSAARVIELTDIDVRFGATHALDGISMVLNPGECVALAGQNGAGKSTIVKLLTGVYPFGLYTGTIAVDGAVAKIRSPGDAEALGIAVVQQELTVCPTLTVAENLLIGREPTRAGVIRQDRLEATANQMLSAVGMDLRLDALAGTLSVGQQQMLEIARAVSRRAKILVLDEPTSSLSTAESEILFERIDELRARGVSILYISHRLDELKRVADRVVVIRDGRVVLEDEIAQASRNAIVNAMLGAQLAKAEHPILMTQISERPPVLEVSDWAVPPVHASDPAISSLNLSVCPGEICGIYGAVGSGRSELLMSLYGSRTGRGVLRVDGKRVSVRSPRGAVAAGIALVTEDRKALGLQPWMSTAWNITLPVVEGNSRVGIPNEPQEAQFALARGTSVGLHARMLRPLIPALSGGNQQKAMLARALSSNPRLLLLDEPTRGVDVGAKADLHNTLRALANEGLAVVWVSSEAEELVDIAHRIHVMRDGQLVAEFAAGETTVPILVRTASSKEDSEEPGSNTRGESKV
jgi:ABC-type sugar transport system ATPase subunit